MKKKFKMLFCVMLAVILCMGMAAPASAASAKYNAAVSKYNSFLKKNRGRYEIVDVDKNGIPELLYQEGYSYTYRGKTYCTVWESRVYTYSTSTKKMVLLASMGTGKGTDMKMKYSKTKKTVLLPQADTGGSSYTIYRISGQKATKVLKAEYINGKFAREGAQYKKGYKINGKRVSKSTYNSKINAYMKNAKTLSKISK